MDGARYHSTASGVKQSLGHTGFTLGRGVLPDEP